MKAPFFLLILTLMLTSCATERRCVRKFGNTVTDTVTVRQSITVNVPKDSAVLRLVTDTSTIIREVRQGRATVRIVREPTFTTVYATCDSLKITKEAIAKVPRTIIAMGVSKWYKRGFFFVLGLLVCFSTGYTIARFFHVQISRK